MVPGRILAYPGIFTAKATEQLIATSEGSAG